MTDNEIPDLDITSVSPGHSHLIEANAGTGKTYAIANLFLRFILEGLEVDAILVVTFTNAARDELSARLRKRLADALRLFETETVDDNEDDYFKSLINQPNKDKSILRLQQALLAMNEAAIYTIHGFCQQALTEQAFASGQIFDIEQTNDDSIRQQAICDWWRSHTYELTREELEQFKKDTFKDLTELSVTINPLLKANAPQLESIDISDIESTETLTNQRNALLERLIKEWQKDETNIRDRLMNPDYKLSRRMAAYKPEGLSSFFKSIPDLTKNKINDENTVSEVNILADYAYSHLVEKLNSGAKPENFDLPFFRLIDKIINELTEIRARFDKSEKLVLLKEKTEKLETAYKEIKEAINHHKQMRGLLSFDDMIENLHCAVCDDDPGQRTNLASILGKRYPLVMVDEFQDTDPKQYTIFQRIHKDTDNHTLVMIGDPKQAIYSFRGGDIFNYMQASNDANQTWKLSTNWRSTRQTIEAVNHLFSRTDAFTYKSIPYLDSKSPEEANAQPLTQNGQEVPALTFEPIPVNDEGELPDAAKAILPLAHEATARRIAELLADNTSCIGNKRLKAGDIAILVRKKDEATELQKHLLHYGIRAVTISDASVWDSDEARSLEILLSAVANPADRQLCRQALSAPILNLNLTEIHKLQTDAELWSPWVELFHSLNDQWQTKGFMATNQLLLNGLAETLAQLSDTDPENIADNIADIWLNRIENPERMLTNLGHLAELIQQASLEHPGMEAILAWLRKQKDETDREEYQIRLESDESLVKMITIHKSKGLQYPVVFLPYLWRTRPVNSKSDNNLKMKWHQPDDEGFHYLYTPGGSTEHPAFPMAEHERLAEDVRLAYVALTRAKSHCHVFFGPCEKQAKWKGHTGRTGLAWLLSTPKDNPENELNLDQNLFEIEPASISLEGLTDACEHIQILRPSTEQEQNPPIIEQPPLDTKIAATDFTRKQYSNWRIQSFSKMSQDVHQVTRSNKGAAKTYALQFPAGPDEGNFLHALLEHIDPVQDIKTQLPPPIRYYSRKYGLEIEPDKELDNLADWLQDILDTPLDDTGLTLGSLKPQSKVPELTFDFSTQLVGYKSLQENLEQYAGTELPRVKFQAFEGMVTGAIDLVFEHDGQYFIADYKSNLLGYDLDDYTPDILQTAIRDRRYDLQYLLYTLALHRHLRYRLPDYDYNHHFGGVYYLFLRAMTPDTGPDCGIFYDKPPLKLIEKLDQVIFTSPEAVAL